MRYFLVTMSEPMFAEAKELLHDQGVTVVDTDADVIRKLIEFHELDVVSVEEQ